MTLEELEIGNWYTIGGGDSNLKCLYVAQNYAVFLVVSEVHYTVNTRFMSREYINEWQGEFMKLDKDYLDDDIATAKIPQFLWGEDNYATYGDV